LLQDYPGLEAEKMEVKDLQEIQYVIAVIAYPSLIMYDKFV